MGKNKNQKKHGITSVHVKKFVYVGKIHIINVIYQTIWWEKQQKHGITTVRKKICICGKKHYYQCTLKKYDLLYYMLGGNHGITTVHENMWFTLEKTTTTSIKTCYYHYIC